MVFFFSSHVHLFVIEVSKDDMGFRFNYKT